MSKSANWTNIPEHQSVWFIELIMKLMDKGLIGKLKAKHTITLR